MDFVAAGPPSSFPGLSAGTETLLYNDWWQAYRALRASVESGAEPPVEQILPVWYSATLAPGQRPHPFEVEVLLAEVQEFSREDTRLLMQSPLRPLLGYSGEVPFSLEEVTAYSAAFSRLLAQVRHERVPTLDTLTSSFAQRLLDFYVPPPAPAASSVPTAASSGSDVSPSAPTRTPAVAAPSNSNRIVLIPKEGWTWASLEAQPGYVVRPFFLFFFCLLNIFVYRIIVNRMTLARSVELAATASFVLGPTEVLATCATIVVLSVAVLTLPVVPTGALEG